MSRISRRDFLERSLKLAGLTGFGGARLRELARLGFIENAPAGPSSDIGTDKAGGDRFFGAQTHFGQFRTDVDDVLGLIKGAGIGWIRDEVYWSEVEKEKGIFKFPPAYDHYLRAAQSRGIQVLLILDFSNSFTRSRGNTRPPPTRSVEPSPGIAGRPSSTAPLGVRHYEIWNEPNASTF
jgi:hypothetical protein